MKTTSSPPPSQRDSHGPVVVIDDEPATLRLIVRELLAAGYETTGFDRAGPALEAVLACPPDVVLTDVRLPDRSGHEILATLHAEAPRGRAVAELGFTRDSLAVLEALVSADVELAVRQPAKPFPYPTGIDEVPPVVPQVGS